MISVPDICFSTSLSKSYLPRPPPSARSQPTDLQAETTGTTSCEILFPGKRRNMHADSCGGDAVRGIGLLTHGTAPAGMPCADPAFWRTELSETGPVVWRRSRSGGHKKRVPGIERCPGLRRTAATYSPNWCVSTIGARGLNFSVRDGKRWDPAAKATAIYYLRDHNQATLLSTRKISGY